MTNGSISHSSPKVVLIGPPGAGKSTLGRRVARALNLPLIDTDLMIEERFQSRCGEVFSSLGEDAFREVEAEEVAKALQSNGIVSLGGGAVLTESTRELLADHPVVWVDVSPEEGYRRTATDDSRPVLEAQDPAEHYANLLSEREPFYNEVSDYRVRSDAETPQRLVAEILTFLDTL